MKIRVDKQLCIGAGNCAQLAPKVFGQREDDGIVILHEETPEPSQHADVRKAVKICPSQCISISED